MKKRRPPTLSDLIMFVAGYAMTALGLWTSLRVIF